MLEDQHIYKRHALSFTLGVYLLALLLSFLKWWLAPPMLSPHTLHVSSSTGIPHCKNKSTM